MALGLVTRPGSTAEVTLQCQFGGAMRSEGQYEPATVLDRLGNLLSGMSAGTKRPIRFLALAPMSWATGSASDIDSAPGAAD